jgi:hypothetical protein
MTQLFLPKAKLIEVYCFAEFIQLQLFWFCRLIVQYILSVIFCLLVRLNFMCPVFAAGSTLDFKCPVCVPCIVLTFRYPGLLSSFLRGWWWPIGLMVSFMIFTASVRNILDATSEWPRKRNSSYKGLGHK